MKNNKIILLFLLTTLFIGILPLALAQEESGDVEILGVELEKILNLGGGLLAAVLFFITLLAYKRKNNARLKYVALAFLLFAIKGFLMGAEIFFGEWLWVDLVTSSLDFIIILSFFLGIIKE